LVLNAYTTQVIAVNGVDIDFDFSGAVTGTFPPEAANPLLVDGNGDAGHFDISGAGTGSFAGMVGDTITVHDLNSTQEPAGTLIGPSLPLTRFITFNSSAPTAWSLTLTELFGGVDGTAGCGSTTAGDSCSPGGSPFNLLNEAGNQVLVGCSFLGTGSDGAGNSSSMVGTFSSCDRHDRADPDFGTEFRRIDFPG
jgi:hypothetical protein